MQQKFQKSLHEAIKQIQIADHMAYVTYPILGDPRLILKMLDEIVKSMTSLARAVLEQKNTVAGQKTEETSCLIVFLKEHAGNYGISEAQIQKMLELLKLNETRIASSMEFPRKDKIILLSDNLGTEALDIKRIKEYLLLAKECLMIVNQKIGLL